MSDLTMVIIGVYVSACITVSFIMLIDETIPCLDCTDLTIGFVILCLLFLPSIILTVIINLFVRDLVPMLRKALSVQIKKRGK
jgi:hypothetical protein